MAQGGHREHTMMPWPLSWICRSLRPPALAATAMLVEPASRLFSIISLRALLGRWMTSPAAMRFITCWSSALMTDAASLFDAEGHEPSALEVGGIRKTGLLAALNLNDRGDWTQE